MSNVLLESKKRITRGEITDRLRARVNNHEPVLMAGCGIGIVAKMAERSNLDLISCSSEDRFRMMGQPSCMSYMAVGNANDLSFDALRRSVRVARNTPILCAVSPGDPYRDIECLVQTALSMGADGILSLTNGDGFGSKLDQDVYGSILHSDADLALVEFCHRRNIYTAVAAYSVEFARKAAECGADLIIAHCGFTVGGDMGASPKDARPLDECISFVARVTETVREINQDTFVLCHGGRLNTGSAYQECLLQSGADGLYGGAVFDRIPMEQAIGNVVSTLESLQIL